MSEAIEAVKSKGKVCAGARCGLREKARVCWCAWRLAGDWCARRLEGEVSRVLVLTTLLEGWLLVRGAHTVGAAYVQDILVACTRTAKARCASTTLKLQ